MIWPALVSKAAPTLNLEYGATARRRALAAARNQCRWLASDYRYPGGHTMLAKFYEQFARPNI